MTSRCPRKALRLVDLDLYIPHPIATLSLHTTRRGEDRIGEERRGEKEGDRRIGKQRGG